MDYKLLKIRGISYSQTQNDGYLLLLENQENSLNLPIAIGSAEAQSISLALEKDLMPPRPLTHDIFKIFIQYTQNKIDHVLIHQMIDGVFYSNIYFKNGENHFFVLDARTSDAIALAVRFDAPIYTTDEVLKEAGILLEVENENNPEGIFDLEKDFDQILESNLLSDYSVEELVKMLDNAIDNEDFDAAQEIHEELKRRK